MKKPTLNQLRKDWKKGAKKRAMKKLAAQRAFAAKKKLRG